MKNTFVEVCVYEVKPDKTDEFEAFCLITMPKIILGERKQ